MENRNLDFVAIDFETANFDDDICQIGIAVVENGRITDKISILVQPPNNYYEYKKIKVHGITPEHTRYAPMLEEVWGDIEHYFEDRKIVYHYADRRILEKNYFAMFGPNVESFVDTAKIFGRGKLSSHCRDFGIEHTNGHDAMYDAIACAKLYMVHLNDDDPPHEFVEKEIRSEYIKPTMPSMPEDTTNLVESYGGKTIVITGLPETEKSTLKEMLEDVGAKVTGSVSGKTDIIIAGPTAGPAKMQKAKELGIEIIKVDSIFDIV